MPDPKVITVAIDALENILRVGKALSRETGGENVYGNIIIECGGLDKIEYLQQHPLQDIYDKVRLLRYFGWLAGWLASMTRSVGGWSGWLKWVGSWSGRRWVAWLEWVGGWIGVGRWDESCMVGHKARTVNPPQDNPHLTTKPPKTVLVLSS